MGFQKDIADQFDEIIVTIVREKYIDLMAISWVKKARMVTVMCSFNGSSEALRRSKNF